MGELETVRRIRAGDRSALDALYDAYALAAVRTALLITRSQAAAEDVVQETFVQVFRNIGSLRDPAAFRPWFYRILVNSAKRHARYSARELPLEPDLVDRSDPAAVPPEEAAIRAEELEALRAALGQLHQTYREPLVLRYYAGLSEQETAAILELPLGTLKTRLHTARKLLRERLTDPAIHGKGDETHAR